MQTGDPATFDEVILAVLLAEQDYTAREERFEGASADKVRALTPKQRRTLLLGESQGARDLESAGEKMTWTHATFTVAELDDFYFLYVAPWLAFTGGTCRVRDGAHGFESLDPLTRQRVEGSLELVRGGKTELQPLILLRASEGGQVVIARGCARVNAHLRVCHPDRELPVILGESPDVVRWPWWPPERPEPEEPPPTVQD